MPARRRAQGVDVLEADLCRGRFGRLRGREEGRGLVVIWFRWRVPISRDFDLRDGSPCRVPDLRHFGSVPYRLGGINNDLVHHGLHLKHASLDGPAPVHFDPGSDQKGVRIDLPVRRLVRDDADSKRQDFLRSQRVGWRKSVLECCLGKQDDLIQGRQLRLVVRGKFPERRR